MKKEKCKFCSTVKSKFSKCPNYLNHKNANKHSSFYQKAWNFNHVGFGGDEVVFIDDTNKFFFSSNAPIKETP